MIQRTYILDTNVYGELLIEKGSMKIIKKIQRDKTLYLYGITIIEHELQDVPTDKKIKGKIFKNFVLSVYKSLIDSEITSSPITNYLASEYYKKYVELRKSGKYYKVVKDKELKYDKKDLKVDFEIIAIASLKGVDIVVSADKTRKNRRFLVSQKSLISVRTMLSRLATETYKIVNKINGLRTPKLIDYFEFRKRYIKWKS